MAALLRREGVIVQANSVRDVGATNKCMPLPYNLTHHRYSRSYWIGNLRVNSPNTFPIGGRRPWAARKETGARMILTS
jgi:hypothetical protein